ncbi:MAG: hypothetical protein ACM3NQ_09715 [Bacteroidales bacterium]
MRTPDAERRRPDPVTTFPLLLLLLLIVFFADPHRLIAAGQQAPQETPAARPQEAPANVEQTDVKDLVRKLRHKEQTPEEQAAYHDWRRRMVTVAPFIASKPSTGVVVGAAGSVAFFRGDPSTTHISSATGSATFSAKGQVLLSAKVNAFTRDDRLLVVGDNRFQWTSEDTYGLGTTAPADAVTNVSYDYVRLYDTMCWRLRRSLYAGVGVHFGVHRNVGPGEGAEGEWDSSPYVTYSNEHGLPLDSQRSSGLSVNLMVDSRDNAINAARGWFAQASFRTFMKDFLGGDSTWQELYLDTRTYFRVAPRQTVAFWVRGDFATGGPPPYFDLPATGMDTSGRSARGYTEGRFRGERLLYGEVEYRVTLMASGLLGAVAFLNTTTITNLHTGERLFDSFATGGGVGLRLLMDKRSRTNLCFDVGWGKNGSHGVYLAIQEAF